MFRAARHKCFCSGPFRELPAGHKTCEFERSFIFILFLVSCGKRENNHYFFNFFLMAFSSLFSNTGEFSNIFQNLYHKLSQH